MEKLEKYYKFGFWIALFVVIGLLYKSCSDSKSYKDMQTQESNLRKALVDSATHFKTKEGYWGVEKRTMQADLSDLKDKNLNLTANQQTLLKQVQEQNKNSQTIAAALIQLKAEVANIKNDKPIAETDSTIEFAAQNKDLEYDLTVFNVKRLEFKEPRLLISKITFPNTQTINFHWKDERKEGYPIAFSVVNTNQYFKVSDIQSYAIPSLQKTELSPNLWDKIKIFSKTTGGKALMFTLGLGTGYVLAK